MFQDLAEIINDPEVKLDIPQPEDIPAPPIIQVISRACGWIAAVSECAVCDLPALLQVSDAGFRYESSVDPALLVRNVSCERSLA